MKQNRRFLLGMKNVDVKDVARRKLELVLISLSFSYKVNLLR